MLRRQRMFWYFWLEQRFLIGVMLGREGMFDIPDVEGWRLYLSGFKEEFKVEMGF